MLQIQLLLIKFLKEKLLKIVKNVLLRKLNGLSQSNYVRFLTR